MQLYLIYLYTLQVGVSYVMHSFSTWYWKTSYVKKESGGHRLPSHRALQARLSILTIANGDDN